MTLSGVDRKKLRDGAGGQCSFPQCQERQGLQEAHIVAKRVGGPRSDPSISKQELDRYENLIVLCPTHHHAVVDADPEDWTVEKLQAMKAAHEREVALKLDAVAPEIALGGEFWLEPGAPEFRVDPGPHQPTAETLKLLMTFRQTAGDEVKPVIEWSGANVETTSPRMMPENQRPGARYQKYQLKPALARPTPPEDEVVFDIRFRWKGATRRYRWRWPLYIRAKGIWGMKNTAENVLEPAERTTLD